MLLDQFYQFLSARYPNFSTKELELLIYSLLFIILDGEDILEEKKNMVYDTLRVLVEMYEKQKSPSNSPSPSPNVALESPAQHIQQSVLDGQSMGELNSTAENSIVDQILDGSRHIDLTAFGEFVQHNNHSTGWDMKQGLISKSDNEMDVTDIEGGFDTVVDNGNIIDSVQEHSDAQLHFATATSGFGALENQGISDGDFSKMLDSLNGGSIGVSGHSDFAKHPHASTELDAISQRDIDELLDFSI